MVSLMYPNVNKHIAPETRSQLSHISSRIQVEEVAKVQVEVEQVEVSSRQQARISAPPPYSKEDPVSAQMSSDLKTPMTSSKQCKKNNKREPSLLLEVAVGYRLAKTLTEKRTQRRRARLEKVHDTWMNLGVDTRSIAIQGGQLPPHFWNPPNYGPEEMNARLAALGL